MLESAHRRICTMAVLCGWTVNGTTTYHASDPTRRRTRMAESDNYRKGRALRRELMGDAFVERINETTYADPIMQQFRELTTETVFGALWSRPGLDLKTRTLICVVSDAATPRLPELAIHLRIARRQGWSEDELVEVLLHLSGYVGVPLVREALLTAKEVFNEMKKE